MSSNWSIAQFYDVIDFYKAKEILRKSTLLYFVQFVYQRSSQQKIGQNQHSHSDMTVTKNTDSESFGFQQSTPEVHGSNPVFRDINLNIYFLLIGLKIKNKRPEWTIFNTT